MAVTQGHGNPAWSEDEIILALDLYLELGGRIPDAKSSKVIALSDVLRRFPYHAEAARKPSFRNPAGVAFKLQNLRSVATGKGLGNTSQADRAVWLRWGNDPEATRIRAQLIRNVLTADLPPSSDLDEGEEVFSEGRIVTYAHNHRERNPKLRRKLLKKRRGSLHCDACNYRNNTGDERLDEAGFEIHHLRPLSDIGETSTKLADLALLCATCHRLMHRAISMEGRWLNVEELRSILFQRQPGSGGDLPAASS